MTNILTVCAFCGCGCGLYLRVEGGKVVGVMPSLEHPVSKGKLCDRGWHAHEPVGSPARLLEPLVRRNGRLRTANWEEALAAVARKLQEAIAKYGAGGVGVLGSGRCTNEANFVASKLARAAMGTNNVDFSGRLAQVGTLRALRDVSGRGGQARMPGVSLGQLGEGDVVLLCEGDLAEQHPQAASRILDAAEGGADQRLEVHNPQVSAQAFGDGGSGTRLITVSPRSTKMARMSAIFLQPGPGKDAIWVKGMVKAALEVLGAGAEASFAAEVEGFTPEFVERETGIAAGSLLEAARLFASADRPIIIYSSGLTRQSGGAEAAVWLGRLAVIKGGGICALTERCNVQGACDMGMMPESLGGYQALSDEQARGRFERAWGVQIPVEGGLAAWEMPEKVKAMLVMGDDPIGCLPDTAGTRRALEALDFLAVQDSFLTETAKLADVVLPAALFAEEEGTFTNVEGRVQRVRKAVEPPGGARACWEVVCEVAARMGYEMGYSSPEGIMEEIASLVPLYEEMTYERIGPAGSICRGVGVKVSAGFSPLPSVCGEPQESADEEYPFLLVVESSSYPWQGDAMVENSPTLAREYSIPMKNFPAGFVEMNPRDAESLRVRRGAKVRVVSRRGEMVAQVAPQRELREGTVLLPFFLREMAAGVVVLDGKGGYPAFEPCPVRIERLG